MSVLFKIGPAGGIGGSPYDDQGTVFPGNEDAGLFIAALDVWATDVIQAIQPTFYNPATGSSFIGNLYGVSAGNHYHYNFSPSSGAEIFIGVWGSVCQKASSVSIGELVISTNRDLQRIPDSGGGSGLLGTTPGQPFSLGFSGLGLDGTDLSGAQVAGFWGRSGAWMDAIGVYLRIP